LSVNLGQHGAARIQDAVAKTNPESDFGDHITQKSDL
jgi:hypothetical protein